MPNSSVVGLVDKDKNKDKNNFKSVYINFELCDPMKGTLFVPGVKKLYEGLQTILHMSNVEASGNSILKNNFV